MTLYSEIWGETEKPGTMMATQPFIRDDHPGVYDTIQTANDTPRIPPVHDEA